MEYIKKKKKPLTIKECEEIALETSRQERLNAPLTIEEKIFSNKKIPAF